MTRTEYLSKLDNYLHRLPQEDYQEAMDYFTEYFDEAGPENEARVIQELGSPQEAAQAILNALWDKKEHQEEIAPITRSYLMDCTPRHLYGTTDLTGNHLSYHPFYQLYRYHLCFLYNSGYLVTISDYPTS